MPADDAMTIAPLFPAQVIVTNRTMRMAEAASFAISHVLAFPPHGDECDYCRTRRARVEARGAREERRFNRIKRIAMANPTERNLEAYAAAWCRENGYDD